MTLVRPDLPQAFTSLVNPGRPIPHRPWISPGLTNETLATAPRIERIEPALAALINGRWLLGHNVGVDWRLLSRRLPSISPAGLIDTLVLARALGETKRSLSALVDQLQLTTHVNECAPGSQPHRALWDAVATAYVLERLIDRRWHHQAPTFETLRLTAGISLVPIGHQVPTLFE